VSYQTFDSDGREVLRLVSKPESVLVNENRIQETKDKTVEGWVWEPLEKGGVLRIHHVKSGKVSINMNGQKKQL
jgi:hypothetical protein